MYGKIFDSIYDGTLYGHWQAIVTMQQLIVLANADGIVDMTPQAISARTSIPLDIILQGLKVLAEPDPYTRTPGEDGRRIVLIDSHRPWGWRLVNHGKYARLRNMEQKREADRVRIAEKRKQNKDVATTSQPVANVAHAYADEDVYAKSKSASKSRRSPKVPIPDNFAVSDRVRRWAAERGITNLDAHFEHFVSKAKAKGYTYADWDEGLMGAIRDDWAKVGNGKSDSNPFTAGPGKAVM